MTRSFCYVVALVALAALVVLGNAAPSSAQPASPAAENPTAPTAKAQPDIPEIKEAIEFFKKRDIEKAEALLEKAYLAHKAELPPPQIILAQFFASSNQPGYMRVALEKAAYKYPDDPESYVIFGNIALQERRVTDAALLYAKAKELLPKLADQSPKRRAVLDPQTTSGLAAVAEARDNWTLAQTYLDTLLQQLPKDKEAAPAKAQALQRLARSYFQQRKPKESLENLSAAYAADPQNVLAPEAALGRFYEQFPDHENAIKWMGHALSKYPEDLRTRLVIGQWALETDQIDEALKHATKAMQLDARSMEAKILRGVVALFQKQWAEAEKYFEEAHLQSPGNFAATNNLALALCEQKDETNAKVRRALEYADNNFRQNPKNSEAASTLGWVLYKAGDLDKAEQALRMAAQSGQLSADTAYYLAQISYDRGRKDDAKALLEATLKGNRPFSMKPEATKLLEKLKSEPAAKPAPKKDEGK